MAGKGINSQVPLIITDYVHCPTLILSEPGTQTQLLQETFSNKLQNFNLLVPWNFIGKLSSVLIHIPWLLILNCSKWFHMAQIWLLNKDVNTPGSETTNFMSFSISHSTWGETCHTTNPHQVQEVLSHAESTPLGLDVLPVFLPVWLACGKYSEKTHTKMTAFLKGLKCYKQGTQRKNEMYTHF